MMGLNGRALGGNHITIAEQMLSVPLSTTESSIVEV